MLAAMNKVQKQMVNIGQSLTLPVPRQRRDVNCVFLGPKARRANVRGLKSHAAERVDTASARAGGG
jgi:hypothetical protein